jgi:hypothetical protein
MEINQKKTFENMSPKGKKKAFTKNYLKENKREKKVKIKIIDIESFFIMVSINSLSELLIFMTLTKFFSYLSDQPSTFEIILSIAFY